jgi:hypothetical protein
MSDTLPTVITAAGLQPQSPASLRTQLLAGATTLSPGLTADLPGVLIEDIASTEVAGLALIDSARVEFFNSLTPYTANPYILNQLGVQFGVPFQAATNTSVYVQFTGTPGFLINIQFLVSDGTYQYVIQSGGAIGTDGLSAFLFAIATTAGSWAVPANSVTSIVTSIPIGVTLSVNNPQDGIPASAAQTTEQYRALVLQAGLASAQGMPSFMKTLLSTVPNVSARLVSIVQGDAGWEIICGGGDKYQIAGAIYLSDFDITRLVGSTLRVTGITQANPGVVTTNLNHGYTTGQVCEINGIVGMTALNGVSITATVLTEKTFSIGTNTTSYGAYVSGGVVTPNLRNITANVYDYPDTYTIPFVNPPSQTVAVAITWNTLSPYLVSGTAMTQAVQPAIATYINSIPVGQPINELDAIAVFQAATAALVPTALLSRLVFVWSINGITTSPESGTYIIDGDPESFFSCPQSNITVTQG